MWQVCVLHIEVLGGFLTSKREHLHLGPISVVNSAQNYYSTSTLPGFLFHMQSSPFGSRFRKIKNANIKTANNKRNFSKRIH